MKKVSVAVALIGIILLIAYDARIHFDSERLEIKRANQSDQRHWNLYYSQRNVFNDSSMRYWEDFQGMRALIEPGSLLLSDLASSYFAAAELPVYAVNVHLHHGRWKRRDWQKFLDSRTFCYQDVPENKAKVEAQLRKHPDMKYVLVNRDGITQHRKRDCLAFASRTLIQELPAYADLVFQGEQLDLYKIR